MTKKELVKLVGNEEQAEYVMELVLKNLRPGFIRSTVQIELDAINREIQQMKEAGFIYTCNGSDHVNWGKAEELNGWNLSEEQQAAYDAARNRCSECSSLLYRKNRVTSLLACSYHKLEESEGCDYGDTTKTGL